MTGARPEPAKVTANDTSARGIAANAAAEWRRILDNRGAFGLFVMAPIVYGVLYPQPYLTEILRDVPIAVVDSDLNELSRDSSRPWTRAGR